MSLEVEEKYDNPVISHDDECSICIESLLSASNVDELVARVASCQHCYHDLCIRSWSEQANSCPKCRSKFNKVELIDKFGNLIYDYTVQDKQFPVDPNYGAPQEDDEDLAEEQEVLALFSRAAANDRAVPGAAAVSRLLPFAISCALCSSSSTTSNVNICQSCSCSFHPDCLGMSDTYIGYWNCPMCDCLQQSLSLLVSSANRRTRTRRSRQTIRTDATYARLTRASRRQQQQQGRTRSNNVSNNNNNSNNTALSSPSSRSSTTSLALPSSESTPPTPSREEEEAWKQFEMFRKNPSRAETVKIRKQTASTHSSDSANVSDTASSSNSTGTSGSTNNTVATKKLKRPSRRGKSGVPGTSKAQQTSKVDKSILPRQQVAPTLQSTSSSTSSLSASIPGGSSNSGSRVMTLLTEMHTNSQTLLRDSSRSKAYRNYEPQRLYGQLSPPLSPDYRQTRMLGEDDSDIGKEKVPLSD